MVKQKDSDKPVQMIDVTSSNLESIGYDEYEATLFVRFKGCTTVYAYQPVPPVVWLGLKFSQSKGSYLKSQVIPFFQCRQLPQNDLAPFKSKVRVQ